MIFSENNQGDSQIIFSSVEVIINRLFAVHLPFVYRSFTARLPLVNQSLKF